MSRYETRYLTWQYFSLSGIRLTTGTWAFLSFRVSPSLPWCLPFYLYVQENQVVIWAPVVPNITPNITLNIESFTESPLSAGGYLPRLSNSAP